MPLREGWEAPLSESSNDIAKVLKQNNLQTSLPSTGKLFK